MERLSIGQTTSISYKVKEDDRPTFEGGVVHNVCSTYVLSREIEWCTRQFVLNIKKVEEEGIGTQLSIDHISPAFVGEELIIEGKVDSWNGKELICDYEVKVGDRLIAKGKTGQKLLKKVRLEEIFSKFESDGK